MNELKAFMVCSNAFEPVIIFHNTSHEAICLILQNSDYVSDDTYIDVSAKRCKEADIMKTGTTPYIINYCKEAAKYKALGIVCFAGPNESCKKIDCPLYISPKESMLEPDDE